MLKFLIYAGADVNINAMHIPDSFGHPRFSYGSSLLHIAFSLDRVEFLLENGANFNKKNNQGETVLYVLVERILNVSDSIIINDIILQGPFQSFLGIIKSLLTVGALVNEQDNNGNTLLHVIAVGSPEYGPMLMQLFLEYGANPLVVNNDGLTPRQALQACMRESSYVCKELNEKRQEVRRLLSLAEEAAINVL